MMEEKWPAWLVKFARRIMALSHGRYMIVLTVTRAGCDWTVMRLGKVER